jgi:hypothetical protein
MKHIIKLTLFAVASFLSSSDAPAQPIAEAVIPFDFTCQQQVVPHGTYTISVLMERFIELRAEDGKVQAISTVEPNVKIGGPGTKLVFHRYGDRYFLSEVQTADRELGMKLPMSKAERQTRLNEAQLQRGDTALIALP